MGDARKLYDAVEVIDERNKRQQMGRSAKFGLCDKCSMFEKAESEFAILHAKCGFFRRFVSEKNPVLTCSHFEELGRLPLHAMVSMAWDIDVSNKVVGFTPPDKEEEDGAEESRYP